MLLEVSPELGPIPEKLVRREARLNIILDAIMWAGLGMFFGGPIVARLLESFGFISNKQDVFWMIATTAISFVLMLIRMAVEYRHECVREELVFEQVRRDSRAPSLLLRSFSDPSLGYGLYFTEIGDKGAGQYEGPNRFRMIARSLGSVGPLIVLCRSSHEDAILRTERFEHLGLRARDDNWVDCFRLLALGSRVIMVVPGVSPGLLEEVRIIGSHAPLLRKTLVFMPSTPPDRVASITYFDTAMYRREWDRIRANWAEVGVNLPEYREGGCVYFPAHDFSVGREIADLGLFGLFSLANIVTAGVSANENPSCSTRELLRECALLGVDRLETAQAGARGHLDNAIFMLFITVVFVLFWWYQFW